MKIKASIKKKKCVTKLISQVFICRIEKNDPNSTKQKVAFKT